MDPRPHDVTSKKGMLAWTLAAAFVAIAGISSLVLLESFRDGSWSQDVVGTVAAAAFLAFSIGSLAYILTSSIVVSSQELTTRSVLGSRSVQLKDITEIKVLPLYGDTFIFGYNVVLKLNHSAGLGIYASIYANGYEILRRLIANTLREAINVDVDRSLLREYGRKR